MGLLGWIGNVIGFRRNALKTGIENTDFDSLEQRRLRYAICWAAYDGSLYDENSPWAKQMKVKYGLYKHIRSIYNPTFRLVEFWRYVIWGGSLDMLQARSGAIPIVFPSWIDNELEYRLRKAIVTIWEWSNWDVNKDICVTYGTAMGDVGIKVVDDPRRRKVYLEVVHPAEIVDLVVDRYGNVKAYKLERDAVWEGKTVKYAESAERGDGESVVFRTFKDDEPFAWNGIAAEWVEQYGFVPFVLIKHNDIGRRWGLAEVFPVLTKIFEVDDLASLVHDYARIAVRPAWLANFLPSEVKKFVFGGQSSQTIPLPSASADRDEAPVWFVSKTDANLKPIVANLDLSAASREIEHMLAEFERDYPELQMDVWRIERETSALALTRARQKLERKVVQRRSGYDNALTRALKMAIAIGGYGGYDGFDGFGLESYAKGDLEFEIKRDRPVFDVDEAEKIERGYRFWQAVATGAQVVSPDIVLESMGWGPEQLKKVTDRWNAITGSVGDGGEPANTD